jgi:hypothetical protein
MGTGPLRWAEDAELQAWLDNARLNLSRHWGPQLPAEPTARVQTLQQVRDVVAALNAKLEDLLRTSTSGSIP